jgi:hypothetical protein
MIYHRPNLSSAEQTLLADLIRDKFAGLSLDDPEPMLVIQVCTTLKQAENLQSQLYDQWDSVELIKCPTSTEHGTYIFRVITKLD